MDVVLVVDIQRSGPVSRSKGGDMLAISAAAAKGTEESAGGRRGV